MKKLLALTLFILCPLCSAQVVTGSVDVTDTSGTTTVSISLQSIGGKPAGRVAVYSVDWLSDSSGNATATFELSGTILRVVTNPDGGALAPSANYDIAINDEDGIDAMQSYLANRHTSNSEQVVPLIHDATTATSFSHVTVCGTHTLAVTNAGDANAGVIKIYVEQ